MSINLYCPKCRRSSKLGVATCLCGNNLRKNRRYRTRFKMPDGTWSSKVVDKLDTARKVEGKYRTQSVELSEFDVKKAPSIDVVWTKYLAWAMSNKRSWGKDKQRYEKFLQPFVAGRLMNRITPTKIQESIDSMKAYAPATKKQVLTLIKRVYNFASKRRLYQGFNPATAIELESFDNRVTNTLNKDQVKALLNTLDSYEPESPTLLIKALLLSGRRRNELISLKWKDVDLNAGLVTFRAMNTKNKTVQTVPTNEGFLSVLRRCEQLSYSEYVFEPDKPNMSRYYWIDGHWQKIRKLAKVNIRLHDLRHCFASYLASSGEVDIYTLKELLGHKTLTMTMRYSHLVNGALERGAAVADKVFDIK